MAGGSPLSRRTFFTGTPYAANFRQQGNSKRARTTVVVSEDCLVRARIVCMSCRDICPEQAIRLRPSLGGLFLPEVVESACTGCGTCIDRCPAGAITLITRDPEADV